MCCQMFIYYIGKIPWVRVGTFFLKIKGMNFLWSVIHDSYTIYVYLNFPVISTAKAT